jgi:hypothetical protein
MNKLELITEVKREIDNCYRQSSSVEASFPSLQGRALYDAYTEKYHYKGGASAGNSFVRYLEREFKKENGRKESENVG